MSCFGRKRKMKKRGSLFDLVFIGAVMLIFAVTVLVSFKFVGMINDKIQTMPEVPADAKQSTNDIEGMFTSTMDNVALFVLIGLTAVTITLASLVRVHPIFIPFAILAWILIIFICGVFSNIYGEISAIDQLSTEADQLIFFKYILRFLPFFVGVIGAILIVVMYKSWEGANA